MLWSFNTTIWLYPTPVDFRKQLDSLIMLVADHLQLNPGSGQLFLFRNRHANKIKLLWWDRNGFWLCYKRLEQGKLKFPDITEQGKLKFPDITEQAMQLTTDQFNWLLSGLDFVKEPLLPEVKATNFY